MEWKIGEIFKYNGEWYQCLESDGCALCDFYELINCSEKLNIRGECVSNRRSDGKPVIFKKLEKVGEPFKRNGYFYQEYKTHGNSLLMNGDASGKEGQFSDSDKKTAENFGIDYLDVEDFIKEINNERDTEEKD